MQLRLLYMCNGTEVSHLVIIYVIAISKAVLWYTLSMKDQLDLAAQ